MKTIIFVGETETMLVRTKMRTTVRRSDVDVWAC